MTDEVFKIKVDRHEDSIQIIEQPADLPKGYIQTYNKIKIARDYHPAFYSCSSTLYLRGSSKQEDLRWIYCLDKLDDVIKALRELCKDRMYKFVKVGDNVIGEIE